VAAMLVECKVGDLQLQWGNLVANNWRNGDTIASDWLE